jgi:predicted CXXCH cytochrome family protein
MAMKRMLISVLFIGVAMSLGSVNRTMAADQCITCHLEWEEGANAPSKLFQADIHREAGLSCADCHGGDPSLDDMDKVRQSKGYIGAPKTAQIPQFCARCHSDATYMKKYNPALPIDQFDKYKTSMHGKLLINGDVKVATCISCHSVHDIRNAKIPTSTVYPVNIPKTCSHCHSDSTYMKPYGIPTDQYANFAQSVHGIALLQKEDIGAPACNDCHGNHGATPPGVDDIAAVCGVCHAKNASLFDQSPHKKAFEEGGMKQCETCHSNHLIKTPADSMLGVAPGSVCADCHSQGEQNKGYETAAAMSLLLDSLVHEEKKASDIIGDAEKKGMAVDDEAFALKDVHTSLVESRTLVHAFSLDKIKPELDKGIKLAAATYTQGTGIIDDYYFRRKGLGIATIIITLLALLIWLKIRQVEK